METKWIENATTESFFKLASQLGANLPFKRTLSLMRLLKCEKIAWETSEWGKDCNPSLCEQRYKSCQDYVNNIEHYKQRLKKKLCHRFLFFKNNKDKFLGYCIVHEDTLQNIDSEIETSHFYLTECVLGNPIPREIRGYAYGNYKAKIPLENKQYEINGNYFSQQNKYTNCCAQAAIKMVLRGYFHNITCEQINKSSNIKHEKGQGNLGFNPGQICDSIKNYSKQNSNCELQPSMLHSDSANPSQFLKSVYHAIESKIPVILLMILPREISSEKTKGHAVSLVGHSFKMNNWGAYGGGYFSETAVGYLSSFLWCDSFIIQDDNFGPFYHLSSEFLTKYADLYRSKISFSDCAMVRSPLNEGESSKQVPLSAIFIHTKEHDYIHQCSLVEMFAATIINLYINGLDLNNEIPDDEDFNLYFYNFFSGMEKNGLSGKTNGHQTALILRSLLVGKNEYLQSQVGELLKKNEMYEAIDFILPEYFWLVEISIPELFWINQHKIGEIAIDPKLFDESYKKTASPEESIIFIRLPTLLSVYEDKDTSGNYNYIDKHYQSFEYPHQHLLKKKQGFLRLACPE